MAMETFLNFTFNDLTKPYDVDSRAVMDNQTMDSFLGPTQTAPSTITIIEDEDAKLGLEEVQQPQELSIPLYMYLSVSTLYCLVFVVGLLGNATVIFVVVRRSSSMRTSTNIFLANLSVADVWVLLICVPTALTEFYAKDVWYLGETLCK